MDQKVRILLIIVLAVLVFFLLFALIRALIGPRRADRILGINMLGSLSTAAIAVLAVLFQEPWLLDVCLIYCMISFLAVVVLAKIHLSEKNKEEEKK